MKIFYCKKYIFLYILAFICTNLITVDCRGLFGVSAFKSPEILHLTESSTDGHSITRFSKFNYINSIRGGKVEGGKKKKSGPISAAKDALNQVLPATRCYLLLTLFCTIVHLTGTPAPVLFSLDGARLHEIWRPFTSISYLGAPSMSMATSLYFLLRYGQTLESQNGTGEHTWFLLIQTIILTTLGLILRFPSLSHSMIAASVYASSHLSPMEQIPFHFGLIITSWQLPFCSMIIDILSQQSIAAAWPHVLGIFSGHFYHFFTKIWPELGGKAWLAPPKRFLKLFGEKKSNVELDFNKKPSTTSKRKLSKGMKGRKLSDISSKK